MIVTLFTFCMYYYIFITFKKSSLFRGNFWLCPYCISEHRNTRATSANIIRNCRCRILKARICISAIAPARITHRYKYRSLMYVLSLFAAYDNFHSFVPLNRIKLKVYGQAHVKVTFVAQRNSDPFNAIS